MKTFLCRCFPGLIFALLCLPQASLGQTPPAFTTQPTNQTVFVGGSATFSVTVSGTLPMRGQWNFNGTNISGATNSSLVLTNVQFSQAGSYAVLVTNIYGSVLSSNAVLTVNPPPPCVPAPSGLVSWWPGEGNADDVIGTNNGTLVGRVSYAAGEVGQAFSFYGTSGYVSIPDSPSLDICVSSITVEAWIKVNQSGANSDWKGIVTKGNSSWQLQGTSGAKTVTFGVTGASPNSDLQGSRNVNDGQWHHVAGVYDGTNMFLYVDGTLDVSQPATGLISQDSSPMCLGANATAYVPSCYCNEPGYFFNGLIDEASIYNRALSASEIQAIYAAGPGGKCPTAPMLPSITTQPVSQTNIVGTTATFSVTASGTPPLSYQWNSNGTNISGATNSSLILTNVQLNQAGNYAVLVTNVYGSILGSNALLTVLALSPSISIQPTNQTVFAGVSATLSVTAGGTPPLSYQWNFNGTNLAWATNTSLTLTNVQVSQAGNYTVLVTNLYGSILSSNAVLTVLTFPPSISIQPTNQTVFAGVSATFNVAASGTLPLSYQWNFNGTNLSGATNTSLTLTNAQPSQADNYAVLVTNLYGSILSSNAVLTVLTFPPSISIQPTNQTVNVGGNTTFSVTASGAVPLGYFWRRNGTPIAWANASSYTTNNVQLADSGSQFSCLVSNAYGTALSSNALLTVLTQPPAITLQPANQTVAVGGTVNFGVTATGTAPLGYFWSRNGTPIAGANSSNYTTNNVQLADSGSQFSCLVSNAYGTAHSSNAVLTVNLQPVHYVSLDSTNPVAPYLSWATAATNIQSAIDAATNGDLILVTNGVYQTGGRVVASVEGTNRLAVTKPVTVQSVNGPALTIIQGQSWLIRCVYLTNGTVLSGFTLTNGYGGVWCESTNAMITNCLLAGNYTYWGGGAVNSTLNNCTLTDNMAIYCGGGADGCTLNNCLLTGNYTTGDFDLDNAPFGGGAYECTLNNCVLTGNSANMGGGSCYSTLNNCTLVGNSAYAIFGETVIDGAGGGSCEDVLNNCIVYYNANDDDFNSSQNYCCSSGYVGGVGNITNAPCFVDQANGNLRLQSNSPCINAGNNSYVTGSTDLDGNPRIVGGTVDMGAYEYQTPTSIISYAWLQQYGLPTDGSADFIDSDGDGMNNWQEWRTGTVPTNAASVLKMLAASNTVSGVMVSWQSVTDRTYFLQRSTNLAVTPAFSTVQTNIAGQAGTTSYTDTNATGSGPFLYRVGVQ
jgi:hypothetical protein